MGSTSMDCGYVGFFSSEVYARITNVCIVYLRHFWRRVASGHGPLT